VQPLSKEPYTETASSALRDAAYQGIVATFPLDAVSNLRRTKGEFLIVVIGQGKTERTFKVKEKHFERLPMPTSPKAFDTEVTHTVNPLPPATAQPDKPEPAAASVPPTPAAARAAQPETETVAKVIAPAQETHERAATVEGSQTIAVRFASTPANAEVDIDGTYWGTTPTASLSRLAVGPHTIVIRKAGYQKWERKIELAPGDDRAVNAELEIDPTKPHIVGLD
jgi:hypothetical protein